MKKPYSQNRKMQPNVYSKYASHASMAQPNDPVYLDTQRMLKIIKTDNKITYFAAITVKPRLMVLCPLMTKQTIDGQVCDSRLLRRDGHYELHLSLSKEIVPDAHHSSILSVDIGEKVIATAVLWHENSACNQSKPMFLGRNVRGLRRRYAYLRKKLGEKKLPSMIRKVGNAEQRRVNDTLHKISRQLVDVAKENNAVILLGDLTGIRSKARGSRMNRIVGSMPSYKLTKFIIYKASWEGIPVLTTKEWHSSKTCHMCGSDHTSRPHQSLFICHACGYSCNADYNGALNLAKRLSDYMFGRGMIGFSCEKRNDFLDSASQSNVK